MNKLLILFLMVAPLVNAMSVKGVASVNAKDKHKTDSIPLTGYVYDRLTSHHIIGAKIEILNPDSSLVSAVTGGLRDVVYNRETNSVREDSISKYEVNIPRVPGKYYIRVSKPGYETDYTAYSIENLKKRDSELEAPKIYLDRIKVRNLEEFTVKASKVMFYHKGDTIVYNADAFALPEGSMLDALVAQMPGVEIKDNKIYVNGRFVDALLLNGKDFFKGDKKVMINNIGAYAVKNIKVYEKKDEMSDVLGDRSDIDKDYVMDVRLKKDHMAGNMINAEAGGGTKSRYIGRLFALHYTNNSRLSVYGNANNINETNKLSDSPWQVYSLDEKGITKRANGGIDYLVDNSLHTWEVNGNVDMHYKDNDNNVITNAVKFLQSANSFDFSDENLNLRNLSFSTVHNIKIKKDSWNLNIKPKFSYGKEEKDQNTVSATFDKEFQDLDSEKITNIYSGSYKDLQSSLINRSLKTFESRMRGYESQIMGESKIKIPDSSDAVELRFTANYDRKSLSARNLQDICFGWEPTYSLLQDQYMSDRPQYDFKLQGLARYYFNIPVGNLNASYEYIHTQNRKNSDVSLLEAMAENSMAEFTPGQLPVPDLDNSYTSKFYKNQHIFKIVWSYKKRLSKGNIELRLEPKFFAERHDLFYHRGATDADPHRSFFRYNIENCLLDWTTKNNKLNFRFNYRLRQNAPNLVNMVDIHNTTDPLNIWTGNPDLKKSTIHEFNANLRVGKNDILSNSLRFNATIRENDHVTGYRYDSATGVRTLKTFNVSGIYDLNLGHSISWKFGSMKNFRISNDLNGILNNYADMIGYDQDPVRQNVRSYGLNENLSFRYNIPKFTMELRAGAHLNRSLTQRPLLSELNSGSLYSLIVFYLKLPLGFSFTTGYNVSKQYGYIEDSMNRIYHIWDAELKYTLDNGKWIFKLEAKDILNQNKGISYSVDATGRKQTLNTVLPRYLMLSVHYRFDFKPKRRK